MALYRYVKSAPIVLRKPKRIRGLSFMLMSLGGAILLWVGWPILAFSLTRESILSQVIAPISDKPIQKRAVLASSDTTMDFTNANVWYPAAPQKHVTAKANTYTLSIPKLKIEDAEVAVSGDDLSMSLVHYGGSGLPGEFGTAVIFGHSMLPQFYSPKNYKSIFSLLPTLDVGDEIDISYDGVGYRYTVFDMIVLDPNDLSVLEQRFDDSYITLVTCVPPGTYWKRLNVKARLTTL